MFIALLIIVIVMAFVPMPPVVRLLLFTVLSMAFGLSLIRVLQRYGENTVRMALLGSTAVFMSMFVIGLVLVGMGIDLGFLGLLLFAALIGLIIAQIIYSFTRRNHQQSSTRGQRIFAGIALALFAMYVVYDTNYILMRTYPNDDFVLAALDYFLDFLNIFSSMSSLTGAE